MPVRASNTDERRSRESVTVLGKGKKPNACTEDGVPGAGPEPRGLYVVGCIGTMSYASRRPLCNDTC